MKKDKIQQEINISKNKNSDITVNQTNNYYQPYNTIEFNEERFKNTIELFLENKDEIIEEDKDKYQNFKRNQAEKHKKNNMSPEYYDQVILGGDIEYFSEIDAFFKNKRNLLYKKNYEIVAKDLTRDFFSKKQKDKNYNIIEHMSKIKGELLQRIGKNDSMEVEKYIIIFLHYMYQECDYGIK
ncbi:hypothetical protein EII29_07690 [Leptotrichia sp. OH3620_COT-345]|uniref:ABC-three component system protein n=1 Tax=Leptotrichia sp. OH3620_COT-345 TaxID=2491048 RepID=UPI000F648406|nr:hypothetical protein [Leptotrichia sp. OH3620_COT-345]RRD39280.1 hypothetical protein EII29_07690 [Leptotrichia sp. OH3620_COT-345]